MKILIFEDARVKQTNKNIMRDISLLEVYSK